MQKEELIARLGISMEFQMVANLTAIIENNDLNTNDLLELSSHKKKEIAFRAAWMLEYVMVNKPRYFCQYITRFLILLPQQRNASAMRHYAKITSLLTEKRAPEIYKETVSGIDFGPTIDTLFTWLIDPDVLVATKVHCMQALANLSPRHRWIREELLQTIDHLIDVESIAFFARAKQIRKILNK